MSELRSGRCGRRVHGRHLRTVGEHGLGDFGYRHPSLTVASWGTTDGVTRGLCVVRTWEDERKIRQFGDVSVVWASTSPKAADTATTKRESATTRTTTSITWNYEIDEGFTYALTVLATNRDDAALPDVADCSSGDAADSPSEVRTDDFPVSHRVSDPASYRNYQLCARAENDYGASEWAFIGDRCPRRCRQLPARRATSPGRVRVETEELWRPDGHEIGVVRRRQRWDPSGLAINTRSRSFGSHERSVPRSRVQNVRARPRRTRYGAT